MNFPPHHAAEPAAGDAARLLAAADEILRQGELLLGALDAATYARRVPAVFNASLGGHYRHCLDHFASWSRALDADVVDYDDRRRDPRLEADPACALAQTRELRGMLAKLDADALAAPIRARCEVSYAHGASPVTASSCGRELAYAIAHAIHHYALIAVMARLLEIPLPAEFGVAPSTVAHQRRPAGVEAA
ncbi:MAG: DinB family protein [Limisphaerales bacterium]